MRYQLGTQQYPGFATVKLEVEFSERLDGLSDVERSFLFGEAHASLAHLPASNSNIVKASDRLTSDITITSHPSDTGTPYDRDVQIHLSYSGLKDAHMPLLRPIAQQTANDVHTAVVTQIAVMRSIVDASDPAWSQSQQELAGAGSRSGGQGSSQQR